MSVLAPVVASRPRPVAVMTTVTAVVSFLAGSAGLADLIPKTVMAVIVLLNGALTVGWGAWTQSQVTPLASPQATVQVPLVPAGNSTTAGTTVVVNGAADPAETARVVAARLDAPGG